MNASLGVKLWFITCSFIYIGAFFLFFFIEGTYWLLTDLPFVQPLMYRNHFMGITPLQVQLNNSAEIFNSKQNFF